MGVKTRQKSNLTTSDAIPIHDNILILMKIILIVVSTACLIFLKNFVRHENAAGQLPKAPAGFLPGTPSAFRELSGDQSPDTLGIARKIGNSTTLNLMSDFRWRSARWPTRSVHCAKAWRTLRHLDCTARNLSSTDSDGAGPSDNGFTVASQGCAYNWKFRPGRGNQRATRQNAGSRGFSHFPEFTLRCRV